MKKEADIIRIIITSLLFISISLIFFTYPSFVVAEHFANFTANNGVSLGMNSTGTVLNISINNTDTSPAANISQLNITFYSNFNFTNSSNGTDATASFVISGLVLSWTNYSHGVVNSNDTKRFWINITARVAGKFNITVTTLNITGTSKINLSITVNDTTPPDVTINSPTNGSNFFYPSATFNITTNENSTCLYSLNSGVTNISMTNNGNIDFTHTNNSIPDGSYTMRAYCNDTAGNQNNSISSTFTVNSSLNWALNGTVYDVNRNRLVNATINITIRDNTFTIIGYNFTRTNSTGQYNFTVQGNTSWFYQPVVKHYRNNVTDGSTSIDYMGMSLPAFPYTEMQNGFNIDFYLREAGTLNITARNSSNGVTSFQYIVKDIKLGYPIAEQWTAVTSALVEVPRDRNYSIQIYPTASMPVYLNWNNFSSTNSYNFSQGLSLENKYNATTYVLSKQFNVSVSLVRLVGNIFNSSGQSFTNWGWNEFIVVPYLEEPGGMIYLGDNAAMPYNMSAWNTTPYSDSYGKTGSGRYNITLSAPAESVNYILFASGRNETSYYGGYLNLTLSYGNADTIDIHNFSMYPLMSRDWGSANSNITMRDPLTWAQLNFSSAMQNFYFINSTGSNLSQLSSHVETKVDYSSYGAKEFTFMLDTAQTGAAGFYLPLLNATGIKEMKIYSMNYAPKKLTTKTANQILNGNNNITLKSFNPQDIDGRDLASSINVSFYTSNATCDVPDPPSSCALISSSNMDDFNPLKAIIGGGKSSFRMGLATSGIEVHYVNVDMMASGPPDALFDDSTTNSTSGGFSSAMRFGSSGPSIYDFVLVSMPYVEGSSSKTGLNESVDLNMSIPVLYDDSWNVIWNVSLNGTSGSALAGNFSHYNTSYSQWNTLLSTTNCTRTTSELNATRPCFINTTSNRIWIRLPHFSGAGPSVTGEVVTASSTSSSSSSGGGGTSVASIGFWSKTIILSEDEFNKGYTKELARKHRLRIKIGEDYHYIGVMSLTNSTATINVSSDPQQVALAIGDLRKFDVTSDGYYDLSVKLEGIADGKAELTAKSISEKVTEESESEEQVKEEKAEETKQQEEIVEEEKKIPVWIWWIIVTIIIIIIITGIIIYYFIIKNK